jgi:hypothetical protein
VVPIVRVNGYAGWLNVILGEVLSECALPCKLRFSPCVISYSSYSAETETIGSN